MVIDIDGNVTVCNRGVMRKTVVANIYREDMTAVLQKVSSAIETISTGNSGFEFCYYCQGRPTRRGAFICKTRSRLKGHKTIDLKQDGRVST